MPIDRVGDVAKFWLDPVTVQRSGGFDRPEVLRILRLAQEHGEQIVQALDAHARNLMRSVTVLDVAVSEETLDVELNDGSRLFRPTG